ncbi:PQ loop repeat-domain-containing protein [Protomyces lactucae-debilis]|uniref:PQ loop repeat-domain-containing protein n=1 Tax=Protomyces lactucae-debilis TaxID=2754530 RepID=A0A1Y2F9B3_PROLT|nr:PQ loop repeat-domain-containing protein [Protomyces lactucae-debilis]ORY80479.1 PQ loop repeat-domain-containing protein [Protomyces lactucae-debilis]
MGENSAAATVFAVAGAICWSLQLVPQIVLNHRRKTTDGFSGLMMLLWVLAGLPLGIYNVIQDLNIGLQIQPQSFMAFALVCYLQTFHYRLGWTYTKSGVIFLMSAASLAGLEVAGIELLKLGRRNEVEWPVTLVGVCSAVLINIGLLPQYWEIYKRRAVIGVSYFFLSVDTAGAVFSFIAVALADEWDVLAAVSYGLLALEELVIFALGFAFWLRDRRRRKAGRIATTDEETEIEEICQTESLTRLPGPEAEPDKIISEHGKVEALKDER